MGAANRGAHRYGGRSVDAMLECPRQLGERSLPDMRHTLPATRCRCIRFASRLLGAALLASAISAGRPGLAQDAKSDGRSELILSNLPPKGSKAYKDLLGRAGKDANGQVLGFTQSEMWSMPTSRIEDVIRQGETLGVKMTRLGADWNQVLKAADRADDDVGPSGSDDEGHDGVEGDDGRRHDGFAERRSRRVRPDEGPRRQIGDRKAPGGH